MSSPTKVATGRQPDRGRAAAPAPGTGLPAATPRPRPTLADRRQQLLLAVSDARTLTWRNLLAYTRVPQLLVFSTIQPIMFVLLFRYVFGGAIHVDGSSYVNFLMPGIFVQTVCFGAVSTGVGLAEDLQKGLIERFRSLPMARSAVLAGRTLADLCRNVFVVLLMTVVGVAVGFRTEQGLLSYLGGVMLVLLFSFALSWGFAVIGINARNAETAQAMAFPLLFPLTFASTAFVQANTMPGWMQPYARNQPVSVVVDAARHLMIGTPGSVPRALAWSLGLLAVLAPLAVRKYRKAS
jgi:ABC-2 type transport system permease protein/oleandomycin transport system permease protein